MRQLMRYQLDPFSPNGLSVVVEPIIVRQGGHGAVLAGTNGKDGRIQSVVAGSNVTIDSTDPNNPVISSTGGGGGGSGITRTVISTSGSFTAGSNSVTDYVYFITANHIPTLPTAISNTNRYTFKNNHTANITFLTTSAQTVDGGTLTIAPSESVDLISNNANWFVV